MGEKQSINFDIREYKSSLRAKYKKYRLDMPEDVKKSYDEKIFSKVKNLSAYKNCKTLLAYVSTAIEVDTIMLIKQALADGKTVALPRCVVGTRDMVFYVIKSLKDLEKGSFSVPEPIPEKCRKLTDFSNAFCIVPALVYDSSGFRLGYGKGYYDRFLSAHKGMYLVGIGYCGCTVTKLVHGRFDVPVDLLVTEKYVKKCGKEYTD